LSASFKAVKDYFLVGKALKSHGTSGHLRLMVEDKYKSYLQPLAFVFIDINGSKVPYKIAETEDGAHFVVLFEDIRGKNESDDLAGKEIWIPVDQVKERHLRSPRSLKEKWEDYRIHDETTGNDFTILRTEEYPQQLMAVIDIEGRDVLIPLNDQLITDIDKENKIISMKIPEGLLDL
jgi:16S rRNA processing protein RimM